MHIKFDALSKIIPLFLQKSVHIFKISVTFFLSNHTVDYLVIRVWMNYTVKLNAG